MNEGSEKIIVNYEDNCSMEIQGINNENFLQRSPHNSLKMPITIMVYWLDDLAPTWRSIDDNKGKIRDVFPFSA